MILSEGTIVGRYRIRGLIGEGGMGKVYRASDSELGRDAALKVLSADLAADEDRVRRFMLEAKAASALNHPNILTVYEIGEFEGMRYIATELINGVTLRERMRSGQLSIDDGLSIALQASSALCAAHEAGIIHRDIKPENLMIRKDGLVKVLDFGLAKLTESRAEAINEETPTQTLNTAPGLVMGTISYMSPEQARGKELDPRTDIFSLGVVLYELFSGKRPFTGEGQLDVISSILKDEPPRLRQISESLPRQLDRIVNKTLRKDRAQRYQDVRDLQIDLEDLREELKYEARTNRDLEPTVLASVQQTSAEPTRRTLTDTLYVTPRFTVMHAILFVTAVAALAGAAIYFKPQWGTGPVDVSALKISEVSSWNSAPGELFSTAKFSPDGKLIAFSSTRSGHKNIWVKQTTATEAIQVTNDAFANGDPIWSPAGDEIAFFSQKGNPGSRGNSTGIWRVAALGGTPRSVGAVGDGSAQLRRWAKGGKIYYESNGNLYAMEVASGASTAVTSFDQSPGRVIWAGISADEKTIAAVRRKEGKWSIEITNIDPAGPGEVVAEGEGEIGGVAWLPERERFFLSRMVDGVYQVFLLDLGSPLQRLTSSETDSVVADAAPDGSSFIYSSAREQSDIWRVSVTDGKEALVSRSMDPELWPAFSPDGTKVSFQSAKHLNRGNNLFQSSIMVKNADAREQPSSPIASNGFLPAWSPDGQAIAFLRPNGSTFDLVTANPGGGGEKTLVSGGVRPIGYSVSPYSHIQTTAFDWSPDGSIIAYPSDRDGVANIWAASVQGGTLRSLTTNNDPNELYYCPIWSPDGNRIAFYSQARSAGADGRLLKGLRVLNIETGEVRQVYEPAKVGRLIGWTADGEGLVVAESEKAGTLPAETLLRRIPLAGGEPATITILKNAYYYNIFLSPDRKQFAFAARGDGRDDLWVVPATGGELKRLTSNNDSDLFFSQLGWSGDGSSIVFGKQTRFSLLSMVSGVN
jgi:eukaryotic-like serine/threonine-protein kinase